MNTLTNLPVAAVTNLQSAVIARRAQLTERGSSTAEYAVLAVAIIAIAAVALSVIGGSIGKNLVESLVAAIFGNVTKLFK